MKESGNIVIELNPEYLGKIDLLIEKGLYKSRNEFIEKSILSQLSAHTSTIEEYQKKHNMVIGILNYSVKDLEKVIKDGKKLHIKVIGALMIDNDVTPELANHAIKEINLAGIFRANNEVKKILAPKRYSITGHKRLYLEGDVDEDDEDDEDDAVED